MTIAHAHKLLDQELLTVPEALLGQHQDVRQALVSLVGAVDVVILDGSTLFSSEWFSAARSGTSERKQTQRFVGSVRAEADRIVAATAGQIHLVIVFDHASARPALKARRTPMSRDNGNGVRCSPQVSPVNFQRRGPDRHTDPVTEWLTNFGGQGEPTLAGHVFDMSSKVTIIISAHEADPLIAASTRVGVIGGVRLQGGRTALASKDSDFFMMIGSERARYRLIPSVKHRVVRVIDLEILERQGKFPGAEGRFVAGLMMGCDYLPTGIKGYGPDKLEKLDRSVFQLATWTQGYEHASAVLYRTGAKFDVRAVCDAITPIRNLYDFYRCDLISKPPSAPRAIEHSPRVLFPDTSFDGGSDEHLCRQSAPALRPFHATPLLQGRQGHGSEKGPLQPLAVIRDQRTRHEAAAVRRLEAVQPGRCASTRQIATKGAVRADGFHLLTPERPIVESVSEGSNKAKKKITTPAPPRVKAMSAKQGRRAHAIASGQSTTTSTGDSDSSKGAGALAQVYRMFTMSDALEDLVREVDGGGPGPVEDSKKRRRKAKQTRRRHKQGRKATNPSTSSGTSHSPETASDAMSIG
ncbi:BZ3500_MvSof-1268-A1-R1_Chr3-1g05794 [Microbotryum saponariae]|uniref:BZ3500_MvSof-1268-A1-R1_Chr3-1g05794 protein n=1 Tax=Microbotryum saponariae TaxID=289078 RepID=A0A2X0LDE5_9BASI|nr:BZ3500_MvSof-1268-A1-R1_Chr3-1g05794 [Microbotryum saponariae]SDA04984.1 BZ3501_MvSof-1269-A2-R1_Chr3-1g05464 [Microbotryum saponariae]